MAKTQNEAWKKCTRRTSCHPRARQSTSITWESSVDTALNKSDQFTKIIPVTDFQRLEDEMMPEIPNEGDDEVDRSLPAASDLAMRGDADQ